MVEALKDESLEDEGDEYPVIGKTVTSTGSGGNLPSSTCNNRVGRSHFNQLEKSDPGFGGRS